MNIYRLVLPTLLALAFGQFVQAAEFFPLQFGVSTNIHVSLISVSENGSVVAGQSLENQLIRWTRDGGPEVILEDVFLASMSGDGSTIVTNRLGFDSRIPTRISDGLPEPLPLLPGDDGGDARLISQDGVIVGTSTTETTGRSVKWIGDVVNEMSGFPDNGSYRGVSANGDVVVGHSDGGPFRWTEGSGTQTLPPATSRPSWTANAFGFSSDGRWAVGRADDPSGGRQHAGLRWDGTEDPERLLPADSSWGTVGLDATPDGNLIGGRIYPSGTVGDNVAGLWTQESGMVPLQNLLVEDYGLADVLQGWKLTGVYDITDDGRFLVGPAINPDGIPEAFLVDLSSAMAADFDGDGDADGDDFLTWQASFGVDSGGDADGDGDTDGDDFLIWQQQFGSGSGSASAAVPEPTSVLLLLGVAVGGMGARRRRSR